MVLYLECFSGAKWLFRKKLWRILYISGKRYRMERSTKMQVNEYSGSYTSPYSVTSPVEIKEDPEGVICHSVCSD